MSADNKHLAGGMERERERERERNKLKQETSETCFYYYYHFCYYYCGQIAKMCVRGACMHGFAFTLGYSITSKIAKFSAFGCLVHKARCHVLQSLVR